MTALPVEPEDPLALTDEQILNLTDEEFELYRQALEAEALDRQDAPYVEDPVGWVHDRLGEFLWSKQQEIARSVVAHRRTAVQACHGIGKTYTMARLVAWWLSVHPPGTAFVVSTAPTFPQVRALLWREINNAHAKGGLPGRTNQTEWWIGGQLVGYGRKPAEAGSFVGLHAQYVLVIIDEGDGVPADLYTAANSLATNEDSRVVVIGNPDTPSGPFQRACRPGSGWNVIQVSAFDSPNFTGEYVPEQVRQVLTGPTYVQEIAADHGVDSAEYSSKVLGQFPQGTRDGVVPTPALLKATEPRPLLPDDLWPVELGVDVGGSLGGDRTVIRCRRGWRAASGDGWRWTVRTDDPEEIVRTILGAVDEVQATAVKVDSIGVGFGIAGSLRRQLDIRAARTGRRVLVHPVNAAHASAEPKRFFNLRAELWWNARENTQTGLWDLSLLDRGDTPDPVVEELLEPTWSRKNGRVLVEKKEDIRARLGRSPDDADALLLAYYVPPVQEEQLVVQQRWATASARR